MKFKNNNKTKLNYFFIVLLGSLSILAILQLLPDRKIDLVSASWQSNKPQQTNQNELTNAIAQVKNVPQGTFNYGGSVCFAPLVREGFHEAIEKAHPSIDLNYVETVELVGCGTSIKPLLEKDLSFLFNTRSLLFEEYEQAQKRGIDLISIPIALDGIAIYSHNSLPIDFITLQQLQNIYLGKITNWQELGGPNLPIIPVSLSLKANTDLQVLMQLNGKSVRQLNLNESTIFVRDYTTAIRTVAKTPGAISLASAAIVFGQSSVKPIALSKNNTSIPISVILADRSINLKAIESRSYPLTRELSIVFRNELSSARQAAMAYSNFLQTQQGQLFLERAGFVPVLSFRN